MYANFFVQSGLYRIPTVDMQMLSHPFQLLVSNHLSLVFLTDYDYVIANLICRYQETSL